MIKFIKSIYHRTRRIIAKNYLRLQPAQQIAVTGSQGKTNTTYVLSKILTSLGKLQKTDINLDTIYNVPITALKVRFWHKFVLFELGVDKPKEMDKHLDIVKPKVALITGISTVHTDEAHFGSLEKLIREKRKIIEVLPKSGYAILNYDDQYVRKMGKYTKARVLWYGTDPNHCNVWADNVISSLNGIKTTLHDGTHSFTVETSLIGEHQIYTIMAAYLVGKIYDLPRNKFLKKIKEIKPLKGRMSVENGPLQTVILNDGLRSNPSSARFGLRTLNNIVYKEGNKIALLADMGELEDSEKEHRELGEFISTLDLDYVMCIGPDQRFVRDMAVKRGFPESKIFWAPDVFEAAKILKPLLKKNDLVYIKGSLYKYVDRVLKIINGVKIKCNVKGCEYYDPCYTCLVLKRKPTDHIHHDETHQI